MKKTMIHQQLDNQFEVVDKLQSDSHSLVSEFPSTGLNNNCGDPLGRPQGENNNCGEGKKFEIKFWLSKLGLAQYAPMFEEHRIDEIVLPLLEFENLEVIGIISFTNRRKIYNEIVKLKKSPITHFSLPSFAHGSLLLSPMTENNEAMAGNNESVASSNSQSEQNRQEEKFDIKTWLSNIGIELAHYAPVFEKHHIDEKVLSLLTYEYLELIGIYLVGDRHKIYAEIEKLSK